MPEQDEPKTPNANAENNSNAVGSIYVGGNLSGNVHVGDNIYSIPADEIPLSSDEIENGLTRFAPYLPVRAPVLKDKFAAIAKKLRATLGADQNSLSPALKTQREDGVSLMKLMCMEVCDISFRALSLGQNPPPYDSRPPFLGLFAFRPEDREFFFGREALVQKLTARIKEYPFLAVVGSSGSGKSSLVMAGLIPALEAEMSYLRPSSAPLVQLRAAKEAASVKTVFVVDQFEELFTHQHKTPECEDFIRELLELRNTNPVVITMRADFWGEVAVYSELKQAMQAHQELIAPMSAEELHSAMEKQAAVVGLRIESSLSDRILEEVEGEPGAMPLLQHALWELWNRRHGLWLKAAEYQAFGGVRQAIASTAENVYDSCTDFERERMRDIFLRLTRLDESGGGRDMRHRVLIEELIPANSEPSATIALLNKLADTRLIVKTDKDVEVAHEALIHHWKRLTDWLNEDRSNLRLREGLSESAHDWEESKRDDSLLNHRGARLELALAMSKLPRYQLNPMEQAYLNACWALRNKEQRERERRVRLTVIASIVAALIFFVLGSFAWAQRNVASSQAATAQAASTLAVANASTAVASKKLADDRATLARAKELAADASSVLNEEHAPNAETATLLALRSLEYIYTDQAYATLIESTRKLYTKRILSGHADEIAAVAFSPDGKYALTGSYDTTALLWDVNSGKTVQIFSGHADVIRSVAFSPNGKYVLTGSFDTTARLWDVNTGRTIRIFSGHEGGIYSVAFSPDGKYVLTGGEDNTARLWNVDTGEEVRVFSGHTLPVRGVAFSPDGKYVLTGSMDNTARLWDAATGKELRTFSGHLMYVYSVAFSPDGKYALTGSYDRTARLWDVSTARTIQIFSGHADAIRSVAFSPDGRYVLTGSFDTTARLWDANTGEVLRVFSGHQSSVYSVSFSPDGQTILTGSIDTTARIWNANTTAILRTFSGHTSAIWAVSYSPNGKTILTASGDNTVRLWSTETESTLCTLPNASHSHGVGAVFSPDGKYILTGSWDNTARLWDADTCEELRVFTGHTRPVRSVAFSPDGQYVLTGSEDNTARLWDRATGMELRTFTGHSNSVYSVAFSPDGKYVLTGSIDHTARLWDAGTGAVLLTFVGHSDSICSVAFSPDGKYVLTGSMDYTARLWDAATGTEIRAYVGHSNAVYSVSFSPDGQYVLTGSGDHTARLWDTDTGKELRIFSGHQGEVYAVTFSPDGKHVLTGSQDNTARLWDVDYQDTMRLACSLVLRDFTAQERTRYQMDNLPTCPSR